MKILHKVILFFLLTSTIVSCEKKLTDLQPIDQIPTQNAVQNMADLTNGVNGVYGSWLGRRSSYVSSFLTDEIRIGIGTEYRNVGNALFNWQYVSDSQDWRDGENAGCWTNLYVVIDRANRLLELMIPVPTPTPADEMLKAQYKGELIALRAMAHLELLRWYAETPEYNASKLGVILQTEYVKSPSTYKPKRNTQGEVMNAINADLATAKLLIPSSFKDISRITKNAVIASQARAALYIKDWQTVIDRVNELTPLQPLTSLGSYASLWTTRSISPANQSTEIIWRLNVSTANIGAAVGSLWQDLNGAVQASPATKLMNSFDVTNDVRFSTFFKTAARNYIAKYGVVFASNGENFQYDIKMIRTSELVLARAEAFAELNMIIEANADLSLLRSNRITGYSHTAINDKVALINAIMNERYKELCYEGHRYFDLKRRSLPISRDLVDVSGQSFIQNLQPTDFRYILPIPQQERFANPNCEQNPLY